MSDRARKKGEFSEESLTWVSSIVSTSKSARTRRAARAKTKVVMKRVGYIVEILWDVKDEREGRGETFCVKA